VKGRGGDRWLHDDVEAGRGDAVELSNASGVGTGGWLSQGGDQCDHYAESGERGWGRALQKQVCEVVFHWIDSGWKTSRSKLRRQPQEAVTQIGGNSPFIVFDDAKIDLQLRLASWPSSGTLVKHV
jgi:hypothetical protein